MDGASYSGFSAAKTTEKSFVDQDISISQQECCHHISIDLVNVKNDSLLATIDDVLSKDTCKSIISFCEQEHPLTLVEKLTVELKSKLEYVIEDSTFATALYSLLLESPIKDLLEENSIKSRPLGFDASTGDWLVHGIDETLQVFKLQPNDKHSALPRRDAQRCHDNNNRSLFSLLIFLNDEFEDGDPIFYFPRKWTSARHLVKDMTVLNETEAANGLETGYDSFRVSVCQGKAILYSHDILYKTDTVRNGCKWLLKANVMLKRNMNQYHLVVSDTERNDYLKCIEYFERGQSLEGKGLYKEASDNYEKALSIRYSYPSNDSGVCNLPDYSPNSNHSVLPETVWFLVFNFLSGKDIENVVKAFNYLYGAQKSWEMRRYRRDLKSSNNALYIPSVTDKSGIITCFTFPDMFFFQANEEACLRVAAMYAACMIQKKSISASCMIEKGNVNLAVYNPETETASPIALHSFLRDIFLDRELFGSVYSIDEDLDLESDFTDTFSKSVDRSFMTLRHKSQFLGVPLTQRMRLDIKWCNVVDEEIVAIVKKKMDQERRLSKVGVKDPEYRNLISANSPQRSDDDECRIHSNSNHADANSDTRAFYGDNGKGIKNKGNGADIVRAKDDNSDKSDTKPQLIVSAKKDCVNHNDVDDDAQERSDNSVNTSDENEYFLENISGVSSVHDDNSGKVTGLEIVVEENREKSYDSSNSEKIGVYVVSGDCDNFPVDVSKMKGNEINESEATGDSENDHNDEEDMVQEEPFEPYILKMIEKNLGPNFEIYHDFVLRAYEGYDDSLACFPLALKDILRYCKWKALFAKYHTGRMFPEYIYEKEWPEQYLLFENVFLYFLSKAPKFNDVYGDYEYHEPEKSTPQQLYIKLLIEVCKIQPGMTYTTISSMKNVMCVPKSSFCICQPPFCGRDRFSVIEKQTNEFFNLLVLDFSSHKLQVTKQNDLAEKNISKLSERDCLFYNSIFSVLCKKKLEELSDPFHYTVHIKPLRHDPPSKNYHKRFPFDQIYDPYDCGCVGAEFEVKQCYNVEDFCAIDHIHVIGGTKMDTGEVVVWTAFGGLAAL